MWTTVNDPIDPQGLYVLLGAQEGAFNRQELFKRERCLFSLSGNISVEFINSKISRQISTSMSEFSHSESYPKISLNSTLNKIQCATSVNQASKLTKLNNFVPFCYFLEILE